MFLDWKAPTICYCGEFGLRVHSGYRMASVNRFVVVVALLAIFGTPELSCFVPRQLLNAAESDCCSQMGKQCDSQAQSTPQSCCQAPGQHAQPYLGSANHSSLTPASIVSAILPSVAPVPSIVHADVRFVQFHSPPLSPPEAVSILRI